MRYRGVEGVSLALVACVILPACQSQLQISPVSASPIQDCGTWNTYEFFSAATSADVERCLEAGANANARDERNAAPLHRAGSAAVVSVLLKAGADVAAVDDRGRTPLHRLTALDAIETLLQNGADVHAVDTRGKTPLELALETRDSLLDLDNPSKELVEGVKGAIATLRAAHAPHPRARAVWHDAGGFEK